MFVAVESKGPAVAAQRVRERWGRRTGEAAVVDGDLGRGRRGVGATFSPVGGCVCGSCLCSRGVFVCVNATPARENSPRHGALSRSDGGRDGRLVARWLDAAVFSPVAVLAI